jgi:penicillin-binding protein 1A
MNTKQPASRTRHSARIILILVLLFGGIFCGVLAGAFIALTRDLPQIRSLETFTPEAITRIYSADDVLLGELYSEKRDPVPLSEIPEMLTTALLAVEDRNFYRHCGIDLKGVLRAIVKDIRAGNFKEGASTITQQLARTLFLTTEKSLTRKIKEAILALQIERKYTKDEILTLYLNQIYLGSGAFGVESAARAFFNKSVADLDLSQCALIAAMPKAPSAYSPLVNPELARKRRNIVLMQMRNLGLIEEEAYLAAREAPVTGTSAATSSGKKAPYFVDYIKGPLEETLGEAALYKGGLRIYTTLSWEMQQAAEAAVEAGLLNVAERMTARGISDPEPQSALISLDVESGGILAMVGGRNYSVSQYNRAVSAQRQPGSAFKPLVFAYAVEQGFSQGTLLLDAPVVFPGANGGKDWMPDNYSKTYQGEMTLRRALALSKNIPAVRLLEMLGTSPVISFSHQMGITSSLEPNLSLALGTATVRLIDLAAAYRVFAAGGESVTPFGVVEIVDSSGRTVWRAKPERRLVLSADAAAITTDMLSAVVQEGTGRKALSLGRPVAGKTGTTDQFKDALFMGYSPSIVTGVWVGQDKYESLGSGETGAQAALPIWIAFMEKAMATRPYQVFTTPESTQRLSMDPVSGQAVSDSDPDAVNALFRKGTTLN